MRKLIENKILDMVNQGVDLSELEINFVVTVADLTTITDNQLLEVYDAIFGFSG